MSKDILILGDLHISRLQSMFREWKTWTFAPMRQVERYAKKHKITKVIQTGDLFDTSSPDQETLTMLIEFLSNSPLEWYFISGNHDKNSRDKNSLTILQYLSKRHGLTNCHFYLKPSKTKINGVQTIFLPWPHYKSKLLNTKPSLVIAHVERKGAQYDNGFEVEDYEFDLKNHFWVIGHLHELQEEPNLVFVGAPMQLRNGDSLNKVFLHLKHKEGKFSYKKIPVKLPYRLLTIKIRKLKDQKWQTKFKQLQATDFVRLMIHKQVTVPQIYLNHPQVLTCDYYGKNIKQAMHETSADIAEITTFGRLEALPLFLGKLGMSAAMKQRALTMAAKYEANLLNI